MLNRCQYFIPTVLMVDTGLDHLPLTPWAESQSFTWCLDLTTAVESNWLRPPQKKRNMTSMESTCCICKGREFCTCILRMSISEPWTSKRVSHIQNKLHRVTTCYNHVSWLIPKKTVLQTHSVLEWLATADHGYELNCTALPGGLCWRWNFLLEKSLGYLRY